MCQQCGSFFLQGRQFPPLSPSPLQITGPIPHPWLVKLWTLVIKDIDLSIILLLFPLPVVTIKPFGMVKYAVWIFRINHSYTMVCPPVQRNIPQASASGLSPIQMENSVFPRRLFCFGSIVILDVMCCYLSLYLLYINIGKNRCYLLD